MLVMQTFLIEGFLKESAESQMSIFSRVQKCFTIRLYFMNLQNVAAEKFHLCKTDSRVIRNFGFW